MVKKVALAYSGGLDTSIIIPWLKENYGCQVVAVCGDVGQGAEVDVVKEKALASGAIKVFVGDLTEDFVADYVFPTLKAGALYEGKYLLGTSFARPVITKYLVNIAKQEGCDAICHGCTGKGNDQVRFELAIKALAPEMKVIAPWREWDIRSREQAIDYAEAHGIPIPVTKSSPYSMDRNIWHLSHEGGELEDPLNNYDPNMLRICTTPEQAPDEPQVVEIEFERGVPVKADGKAMSPATLLDHLNKLGAKHGVGIADMVENRLVGMKSRGIYETPGGTILYAAHACLESLCLDRATAHFKESAALRYAELVYDGVWFHPLREALDAFVDKTQETVTGLVRMKLYKGNCVIAGMDSPYSLYNADLATFGEDEVYNQKDAEGFINLFGLPLKVQALMMKSLE
ncbi:MAG: argininosuccinate synthase [Clostridiales bacterium]|nr:argininosuccinate synthase [Clostridiales bacterium]